MYLHVFAHSCVDGANTQMHACVYFRKSMYVCMYVVKPLPIHMCLPGSPIPPCTAAGGRLNACLKVGGFALEQ